MSDLILYNGRFLTQDPSIPHATAVALNGNRIQMAGRDSDILPLRNTHTRLINLQGKRVLPGLMDAHIHFYDWALLLRGLSLDDAMSLGEVQQRVREAVSKAQPGQWIIGQGWNQDLWSEPKLPNRFDIDVVSPDNPVILWRTDLHLAWVNTLALRAASITSSMPDPEMGIIDRDHSGEPTGILREMAMNLIRRVMPEVTNAEIDNTMKNAMGKLHSLGLTGVHDFRMMGGDDGPPALRAWQRLRAEDSLQLRTWVIMPGESLSEEIALGMQTGFGDHILRLGGVKFFTDGATGPRTAWMQEPYEDAGTGFPLTPMKELAALISRAHQAGISTAIHAIGDRAIRELLDVYSDVLKGLKGHTNPRVPHRIEHVQQSHPDDLPRLAPLGLVASVQPLHLTDDMHMMDKATGHRARWAYAFRHLLQSGTILAFGSDCPVASPNPFWGIHAAVTRQRRDGTPDGGWYPENRLTVAEAVWAYTMGTAQACGRQTDLGTISPGKLADMIVIDRDIFSIDPMEIAQTQVAMTIFDGKVVYEGTL